MEIQRGSDVVILLKLTDIEGIPMRVNDCSQFKIKVWTQNPNNHLVYHKRDIISGEMPPKGKPQRPPKKPANHLEIPPMPPVGLDRLPISAQDLNCLESGILVYSYSYAKPSSDFSTTDNYYDKVKTVVTDIYWRNTNLNEEPSNPVSFYTIEHLKDMIEEERLVRNHDIEEIRNYIEEEYTNKLEEEIRRSTDVDIAFHNLIKTNKEECESANTAINERVEALEAVVIGNNTNAESTATTLADEIARSTAKDTEHDNAIADEIARAKTEENRIETKIDNEISRSRTADESFFNLVETEKTRAKAAEDILTTSVASEVTRATNAEQALAALVQANTEAINAEKQRSNDRDTEHTNAVNTEVARAKAEEARIENITTDNANDIAAETARAQAVEADITSALQQLKTSYLSNKNDAESAVNSVANDLADEVTRATNAETTIANNVSANATNIADEITRAKAKETELQGAVDSIETDIDTLNSYINNEITRATNAESTLTNSVNDIVSDIEDINAEITNIKSGANGTSEALAAEVTRATTAENTLSNSVSSINSEITTIKGNITTINGEISDIKDDISDLKTSSNNVDTALANEVTRATNAENNLANDIANNTQNIISEIARATQVEADITSALQTLKTTTNTHIANANTDIAQIKSDASAMESKVNANTAALSIVTGDADTLGSIAHSLSDAKHYTDDKLSALNVGLTSTLSDYATKNEVDSRIEGLIGTAPAALDTLGEIADALNADSDAITAINNVLSGKINASEVYTKTQIDAKETTLSSALAAEISRAQTAERAVEDAIAVINGNESVIGSIDHAVEDANHYTDDAVSNLRLAVNNKFGDYATKEEVAEVDSRIPSRLSQLNNDMGFITGHQSLENYYTKAQVDTLIENVDVTDQLEEYAKIAETTVIKDNNDNVITTMVIDNSAADDTIEVYTKAQVDSKFALKTEIPNAVTGNIDAYTKAEVDAMISNKVEKVTGKGLSTNDYTATDKAKVTNIPNFWNGTRAQFDAIAVKDNNTIYFIYE